MQHKIIELSRYRFDKGMEDLKSAILNFENGLIKAALNRAYYAIFHAIRAVNAINEFDSKKHSGVIAYFNQFFVHTGKFEKDVYYIIMSAYKIRERSDYDDFYLASKDDAEEQIKNAKILLDRVEKFLQLVWNTML